jgi:hypothetical protein
MLETNKPFNPSVERVKELLRQERETFNQHRAHENRWFVLRLVMGYSSVALFIAIMWVSSYILLHSVSFSEKIVTAAAVALFTDALGLIVSVWKVVLNPGFVTKLGPVTQLEEAEAEFFKNPTVEAATESKDLTIFSARYGAHNTWIDVAPVVRAKIQNGELIITISNQEFGADPVPNVPKKLEVTYSHGGTTYSKMVAEGETFSAP